MTWKIVPTKNFEKQLRKLDPSIARLVVKELNEITATGDPRSRGHSLTGPLSGLWRYRTGRWRILCEIKDTDLIILALEVARRDEIYR